MSKRFKALSHSLYECKYHVVFCPKYRYRVLQDEVAEYVRQQVYTLLGQKELVEVLELNIQADHIHLVVSFAQRAQSAIPPKYAVSSLMGYLKGKLAIRLFERYERLGRKYWGRHLWARGYCVSRVPTGRGIDEEMIRTYVRWQEKRERTVEQSQGKLFD